MGAALSTQLKKLQTDATETLALPPPSKQVRNRSTSFAAMAGIKKATPPSKVATRVPPGRAMGGGLARGSRSEDVLPPVRASQPVGRLDASGTLMELRRSEGTISDVQSEYEKQEEREKAQRAEQLHRQRVEVEDVLRRTSILSLSTPGMSVVCPSQSERERAQGAKRRRMAREEAERQRAMQAQGMEEEAKAREQRERDVVSWSNDFDLEGVDDSDEDEEEWGAWGEKEAKKEEEEVTEVEISMEGLDTPGGLFTGDYGSGEILHRVEGQETLEGLSLRYSVPVAALKRLNALHTNEELQVRDYVAVPRSHDQLDQMASEEARRREAEHEEAKMIFMAQMGCEDDDVALKYLRKTNFNLQEATRRFLFDKAKIQAVRKRQEKEREATGSVSVADKGMSFVVDAGDIELDFGSDDELQVEVETVAAEPDLPAFIGKKGSSNPLSRRSRSGVFDY